MRNTQKKPGSILRLHGYGYFTGFGTGMLMPTVHHTFCVISIFARYNVVFMSTYCAMQRIRFFLLYTRNSLILCHLCSCTILY